MTLPLKIRRFNLIFCPFFLGWNKHFLPENSDDEEFEEIIVDRDTPTTFFLELMASKEFQKEYPYKPDKCESVMMFKDRSYMRVIN